VQPGDTLASIAEALGLTTQALALKNGVRPGRLQPGQTLTLPEPAAPIDRRLGPDSGVARLRLEVPAQLAAGASSLIRLSLSLPELPADTVPETGTVAVERPAQDPSEPASAARSQVYTAWVPVVPTMRVTLTSDRLQVNPVTLESQVVNLYQLDSRTQWMWEIAAPEQPGASALVFQLGGDQEASVLWEGRLTLEVGATAPTPEPAAARMSYILWRSSFEEGFYDYQDAGELTVPNGWTPVWEERDPDDPLDQLNRPEYDVKDIYLGHPEVRTGRYAAAVFTVFSTHDTALYRRFTVEPGRRVLASVWAMGVSSAPDGRRGGLGMRIGIDPTGGVDPHAPTVEYSLYWSTHLTDWRDREWRKLQVEATSQSETMTVFLASSADWPVDVNASHWDDLLIRVGEQDLSP
jgi:LysM repeat protein